MNLPDQYSPYRLLQCRKLHFGRELQLECFSHKTSFGVEPKELPERGKPSFETVPKQTKNIEKDVRNNLLEMIQQ